MRARLFGLPDNPEETAQPNLEIGQTGETDHLTLTELATWLRCSPRTLQRLLSVGDGPPVIRLSKRRLIFPRSGARSWVESRTRGGITRKTRRGAQSGGPA